jgi:molybdate transport system substrate-binding protein
MVMFLVLFQLEQMPTPERVVHVFRYRSIWNRRGAHSRREGFIAQFNDRLVGEGASRSPTIGIENTVDIRFIAKGSGMRIQPYITPALAGFMISIIQTSVVMAAEIKVLSTHAALEVLSELGPQFESATGHKLSFSYDPANIIKRQIENGAAFDLAIVTRGAIDDLVKLGKIFPDTCVDIARSGLGLAVREGAPKPDIGTAESFKQAMLAAKSVIRSTEGTSGLHFEKVLDRLGIADQMKGKIRLGPSGRVAEFVARGEVEIAVQQVSELLPVVGAELVGPFPPELQLVTVFSAGVSTTSKEPKAAKALIDFLAAPTAASVIKAKGLEPISNK